jgi:Tfp pilus assembly protein PilF
MKSLLIITVLLIALCGCENMKTKPGERGDEDFQHVDAKPYQSAEKNYQAGQLKQAKQGFETVLEHNPRHLDAHFRLGNIALRDNQLEQAKLH